eukprot:603188-Prymnesium_polylepis.1
MSLWHCMLCATRSAVAYAILLERVRGAPRSTVTKVLGKGRFAIFCFVWNTTSDHPRGNPRMSLRS